MNQPSPIQSSQHIENSLLVKCAILAFIFESLLLIAIGWKENRSIDLLIHNQPQVKQQKYIEAEVIQAPTQAHLTEEKKIKGPAEKKEAALSKVPNKGVSTPKEIPKLEEENKTIEGRKLAPTHGPIAVHAPPPTIPSYLQDKEIKTHVVIDFLISSSGVAEPRLAGTSGSEELDAIAIATARKWIFRPAEKDGKPIDSKIRLRIVFVVQ